MKNEIHLSIEDIFEYIRISNKAFRQEVTRKRENKETFSTLCIPSFCIDFLI